MFTGLIQDIGTVEKMTTGGMTDFWLSTSLPIATFELGESVACDGACLTVVEKGTHAFRVQASPETLRRTTLSKWQPGRSVNLERALSLGARLGGHLVLGHVDQTVTLLEHHLEGDAWVAKVELPPAMAPYFIEKGSVTLDGVSLTVNALFADSFSIALIPETQVRTTLARKTRGDLLNLEADVIGKYVARLHGLQQASAGLSEESLRKAGFGR